MNENQNQQQQPQRPPNIRQIPNRDSVTSLQVDTLLSIAGLMLNALVNPKRETENIPGKFDAPGEAVCAAGTTFVNACERLDAILKDDSRWTMKFQDQLESNVLEAHKQQIAFMKAQAEASNEITSPHFRYRPTLGRSADGQWIAFLGEPGADNCLVGLGTCPAEALLNFDSIFNGTVPQYMVDWLKQHETAVTSGTPSPPFPKPQKTSNEENTLDRSRSERTPRSRHGKKERGGDSQSSR